VTHWDGRRGGRGAGGQYKFFVYFFGWLIKPTSFICKMRATFKEGHLFNDLDYEFLRGFTY